MTVQVKTPQRYPKEEKMLRQRGLDPVVELALEAEERSPNLEEQEMNVCLSTTPHPIHSAFSVYWSLSNL